MKIGDVVRLKSGGPNMVIRNYTGPDEQSVKCFWFSNDEVKVGEFPVILLKLVKS